MANKTREYGDLLVTLTSLYDWRWNDSGSGADRDGAFWHPQPQGDLRAVGSVACPHYSNLNGNRAVLLVGDNPSKRQSGKGPAVQAPVDYQLIWADHGSGANADGSFWRPVPPNGYISVGDVAVTGHGKPALDQAQVWCLRADLVSDGSFNEAVWNDRGSGANSDCAIWEIVPRVKNSASEHIPVLAGTFRCGQGYGKPDASLAKVPSLYVPKLSKRSSSAPPQITPDSIPEIGDTFDQVNQNVVTLPFTSFFDDNDRASLDNIQDPFCAVTKAVSWVVLEKFPNYQSTSYQQTHSVTTGIRKTESETTEHQTGIKISSEVGYGLSKWSISLNYQFTFSQTSSVEEVQERTMTKTITVAPRTVAIAWGKRVTIQGVRSDGSRISGEISFNVSEEVAVTEVSV
ncbi:hypothetical protein MMYC01_207928 [Madurella mycetomatis]|uniref:Insecticidal crystal toxin domain-containing protein n=1 Tax=Madurella mycetomatis TaxID=100816 RepID=A0A175W4N0_9PEZI|nr:hypothetical protein MMYC01_207928 [Madurella mycetomatis]